jgi:hypothetical protein
MEPMNRSQRYYLHRSRLYNGGIEKEKRPKHYQMSGKAQVQGINLEFGAAALDIIPIS